MPRLSYNLELIFLSTPSARRATPPSAPGLTAYINFYPRPPRGGRLPVWAAHCHHVRISIHALREEGDDAKKHYPSTTYLFLSTPSARRATKSPSHQRQ